MHIEEKEITNELIKLATNKVKEWVIPKDDIPFTNAMLMLYIKNQLEDLNVIRVKQIKSTKSIEIIVRGKQTKKTIKATPSSKKDTYIFQVKKANKFIKLFDKEIILKTKQGLER